MLTEKIAKSTSPIAEKIAAQNEIIEKLRQQIKEQTEKKKALEKQQRQIDKLVKAAASLELAEDAETINYLWESLAAVLPLNLKSEDTSVTSEVEIEEVPEIEEKEEELIKNPAKKNTSNSFFAWQPTSNEAIATYFNIKTGKTQTAYFAANNKQRLAEIETKLMKWFPGVSCSKRIAQRLTQYRYELKVAGWDRVPNFDDSDFGWLTQMYDPSQAIGPKVKDYLCCRIEDNPDIEF